MRKNRFYDRARKWYNAGEGGAIFLCSGVRACGPRGSKILAENRWNLIRDGVMVREDYKKASKGQLVVTILGCILGGGACLALAFLGTFGGEGYTTLVESGYTLITIPCYGLVIICGFGVLFRIPYAAIVAALATIIEFGLYVGIYMHIHWQVHYLMMLKFAVFVCCSQLLVTCLKKVVQEKTIRYVEPEGVPQAHKRTLYTQQVHQVDDAASRQGCSVPRFSGNNNYGGVPQPKNRKPTSTAPSGVPQPRRRG